jgi:hypothetical protein
MDIIGKKSTEPASIHSDFQGIFPLNVPELSTHIHGSTAFISVGSFVDSNSYIS